MILIPRDCIDTNRVMWSRTQKEVGDDLQLIRCNGPAEHRPTSIRIRATLVFPPKKALSVRWDWDKLVDAVMQGSPTATAFQQEVAQWCKDTEHSWEEIVRLEETTDMWIPIEEKVKASAAAHFSFSSQPQHVLDDKAARIALLDERASCRRAMARGLPDPQLELPRICMKLRQIDTRLRRWATTRRAFRRKVLESELREAARCGRYAVCWHRARLLGEKRQRPQEEEVFSHQGVRT